MNEEKEEVTEPKKTSKEHAVHFPEIVNDITKIDQKTVDIIGMGHLNNILTFENGGRPASKRARN